MEAAPHTLIEPGTQSVPVGQAGVRTAVHRYAIVTAVAAYGLLVFGGLIHGTGSSLSCPDWPLCRETAASPAAGAVAIQNGHRLAAGVVSLMTLGLAAGLSASRRRIRPLMALGWFAASLVLVQTVIGALGVLLHLPTPVSAVHTALSLLFFATLLVIALRSRPEIHVADLVPVAPVARRLALVATVAIFFQGVLGGLVRHSGAGLACRDFPLCRGSLWPDAYVSVHVHVMHRMGSLLVALLVFASAAATFRSSRNRPTLRLLAVLAPALVLLQIYLGVQSVRSFLHLPTVEGHLATGLALLAAQLGLFMTSAPVAARGGSVALTSPRFGDLARDVVALTKPRITFMVIVTFLGGLWLAPGTVPVWRAVMSLLGAVLIVSAANALNMYWERDIDRHMPRTRQRPLPQGRLAPEAALLVGTALACASVPLMVLGANGLTAVLGLLAFGLYVFAYTPLKQISPLSLFVGAVPGALPPLMGSTAASGRIDAGGLTLFAILFLWQVPHFLAIAVRRGEQYDRAGFRIYSLERHPIELRLHIVVGAALLLVASLALGPLGVAGWLYQGVALVLGVAFLVASARAWSRTIPAERWAKSLFVVSLIYLPLLFAALAVDHLIRLRTGS